jgi:type II secretory pathway pseudopilin PulG
MKTENDHRTRAMPSASRDGMTLLEVMIASCLSVLLIAGIFAALINAEKGACMASQYVAAFGRARELLEEMRGAPYASVLSGNYTNETGIVLTDVVGSQLIQLKCDRTSTISNAVPAIPEGKDAKVTVTWVFRNKTNEQSAFTTIYKKPE